MTVTKRDGWTVDFDKSKIRESVQKAFFEVDGEVTPHARDKAAEIARYIESLDRIIKLYFRNIDDLNLAKEEMEKAYIEYLNKEKIVI